MMNASYVTLEPVHRSTPTLYRIKMFALCVLSFLLSIKCTYADMSTEENEGVQLYAAKEPELALAKFDSAASKDPKDVLAWQAKCKMEIRLQRYDDAIRTYIKTKGLLGNEYLSFHSLYG